MGTGNLTLSIKNTIYQAVVENKWLDISYVNSKGESTNFYIGITDIDMKKNIIYCDIFNPFKDDKILMKNSHSTYIYVNNIKSATILEHSYYCPPESLIEKFTTDKKFCEYLEIYNIDNDILRYLSDCYQMDNDPFLKEVVMIDGIDVRTLLKTGMYHLDDTQFNIILKKIFKKPKFEAEKINRYQKLALNKFSIDINDKQYVVAYRILSLNFKDKTLKISHKTYINKSFLVTEEKRVTLGSYLDMDPDEFCKNYDSNEREYIEQIKQNFHHNEIVNTRPTLFLLMRNSQKGVDEAFNAIYQMDNEGKLTVPLKAFFGRNRSRGSRLKEANIVVFNRNKINIDQLRVVYNSMVNHITYVKGPPGTGKTETIFNVLLSAYANDKTVLVCSNNNHPVSDIFSKMDYSLKVKKAYYSGDKEILFPMIRLGNNVEMKEAIRRIRSIINFLDKNQKTFVKETITEKSKNKSLSEFKELMSRMIQYENRMDLADKISILKKIREMKTIRQIEIKLDEQIEQYEKKMEEMKSLKDEDILQYAISASEDIDFQNYVYYSSLLRYKKLNNDTYKSLREIVSIEPLDDGVVELNKWLKDDLNMKRLLAVFPIVICTNLSCEKLGSPRPQFDLVIMDEAGQCNTATSLIPIVRGMNLLLVGDTNQLQPVTVIEESINDKYMKKYNIGEEYNYIGNSILSTMLKKDNNSKNILLRYHYRCGRKIASFVNQRFYKEQLKLLNNKLGELIFCDVHNSPNPNARNSYVEEASQIANIIKNNGYKDVAIVTPFVNQSYLINEYLHKNGIYNVKAGTIHTLQGSEKSVIIMSCALSLKTGQKTMEWLKNNHELINVAVTRAKDKFIFVGDKTAIDVLSKNEDNDIKVLSDYVYNKGNVIVPQTDTKISDDFSNGSKNEQDFFNTIQPYFNKRGSKFRIEKEVLVRDAIKNILFDDLMIIGKKTFDIIVQVSEGLFYKKYKTIVAFEIDGGEHIGSKRTIELDRVKENICQKYSVKLIRIPNSEVKDYESIISLFEFVVKDLKNIDEAAQQLSLFDEE